jgi:hypothetical protein
VIPADSLRTTTGAPVPFDEQEAKAIDDASAASKVIDHSDPALMPYVRAGDREKSRCGTA